MKTPIAPIATVTGLLLLAACGGGQDEAAPAADAGAKAEAEESIADSVKKPIEKAEAVEDQLMEHKEAIDDALEEAEEDSAEDP